MESLAGLALLACPLGMALMMWFMAKGMRRGDAPPTADSVGDLRAEHERLGREIARLETQHGEGQVRVEVSR